MQRDKKRFHELWKIVGEDRITYATSMQGGAKVNTLTIIDEADYLMLENPTNFFFNVNLRSSVLMFSGSFKDSSDSFLPKVFKHFKIKAWDCAFVQNCIGPLIFQQNLAAAALDAYITTERSSNAVIIYIAKDQLTRYAQFPQPVFLLNTAQDDLLQKI